MRAKCLVEELEGRKLDSYDLIHVLGLIKESDFKDVWRGYSPEGKPGAKINFFFSTESYYVLGSPPSPSLTIQGCRYSAMVTAQPLMESTTLRVTLPRRMDLAMPRPRRPMTMVPKPPSVASSMISSATS